MFTIALAATLAAAAAAPIPAAENAKVAPPVQSGSTPDAKTDTRRVCIVGEVTGSRLPIKTCQTRALWIAQTGIDPLTRR